MHSSRHLRRAIQLTAALSIGFLPNTQALPPETPNPITKHLPYTATLWQISDGLPFDQINDVIQTRDGFIWIATPNGAARFDGHEFLVFNTQNTPAFANNRITTFFEDSRGRLWMAHDSTHISIYSDEGVTSVKTDPAWNAPAFGFVESTDGTVWAVTQTGAAMPINNLLGGPVVLNKKNLRRMSFQSRKLVALNQNELIVFSGNNMPSGELKQGFFNGNKVNGVYPGLDGGVWGIINDHVQKWKDGELLADYGETFWISDRNMRVLEANDGRLIVGTSRRGVFLYGEKDEPYHISRENILNNNNITCMMQDREGTIWVGTESGLTALRKARFDLRISSEHWKQRSLLCLSPRKEGGVWAGSDGNGLYSITPRKVLNYKLSYNRVSTILETADGTVWINDVDRFLYRSSAHGFEEFRAEKNRNRLTRVLHGDPSGTLWAGGLNGVLYWNGSSWSVPPFSDPALNNVQCIASQPGGTLWFGTTSSGLFRYGRDKDLKQFNSQTGFPSDYVSALYHDSKNETLWVGTCGGGLVRIKGDEVHVFTAANGVPDSIISLILDDGLNRLWMQTEKGIAILEKDQLDQIIRNERQQATPLVLDAHDGFPAPSLTEHLQGGCRTADGRFWFAVPDGIVRVNPADVVQEKRPVAVTFEHMLVNNAMRDIPDAPQKIRIGPGIHRLNIHFTSTSFIAPHRIQFKYRMSGHAPQWTDAGTGRTADFQNVLPGTYTLEVLACNSDGVWNAQPQRFTFTVLPYFWQTWFFKVVVVLTATLLVIVLSLAAADRINRRKLINAEKLRAIEEERSRISMDIHDEIGAGITRMAMLTDDIAQVWDTPDADYAHQKIAEMESEAYDLVHALDEIVWVVTPGNDTLNNMCDYLEKYVTRYLMQAGIGCRVDIPFDLPDRTVPGPIRHNMFLCVKEAVNNIVKHAKATEAGLCIHLRDDQMTLKISDNGKGITGQTDTRFHRGIEGMKNRMEQIKGSFELYGTPDGGTTVQITLSLPAMHRQLTEIR